MVTDLHVKYQVNIYKRLEKKCGEAFDHENESNALNFAKNQWSVTKLKVDL